jgi:Flp pilus assembly protein protease CpaA
MFSISFYIFSLFLSYTDSKKFLVPNDLILSLALMLFVFGFLESKIYISSIILALCILALFIGILLLNRTQILGGGDIKYMILVGVFLGLEKFFLFLIISGVLQTLALFYKQQIKKRRVAPMVPMMFIAVIITELLIAFDIYKLKL